ncbi:MAG: patatin-like phospholipase family protein [Polyangiaceae bacterium]
MTSARIPDGGVALVLSGAVAKGAFSVGAIGVFAARGWPIRRIAATSSGALTAAVLGAGIATGRLQYAAEVAQSLWLDHGAWGDITHLSWTDWLHARGISDTSKLVALVQEGIQRVVESAPGGVRAPVKVTLVTSRLSALPAAGEPLPRYELDKDFDASDFVDGAMWSEIATCAAASASFPGLFAPTMLDGLPCIDGGAVNNAPISCLLDDPQVQTVIVITTESRVSALAPEPVGVDLIAKLADILINERIVHDLGLAEGTNTLLRRVTSALDATGANAQTRAAVLGALGWRDLRLILVCPDTPLEGTALSTFADRNLRHAYIEAGRVAAEKALGG